MVKRTSGKTILCIEDEEDIRSFACKVLELEGYFCLQAKDSNTAFRLLKRERIDLVMLDLKLADTDGWQVLEEIRKDPMIAATPVIICTATFGEAQQERARNKGAADYLVKPLSAETLREAVFRVLPIII